MQPWAGEYSLKGVDNVWLWELVIYSAEQLKNKISIYIGKAYRPKSSSAPEGDQEAQLVRYEWWVPVNIIFLSWQFHRSCFWLFWLGWENYLYTKTTQVLVVPFSAWDTGRLPQQLSPLGGASFVWWSLYHKRPGTYPLEGSSALTGISSGRGSIAI